MTLCKAIIWTGLFVAFSIYCPVDYLYTQEYGMKSIPYKFVYFMVAGFGLRVFYYGPFNFTTAAIQSSGLGYNGKSEERLDKWEAAFKFFGLGYHRKNLKRYDKWDKIIGVYVWKLESSWSCLDMLRYWNH